MPFLAGWYRESGELAIRASLESVACGGRLAVISDCFPGIGIFQQPVKEAFQQLWDYSSPAWAGKFLDLCGPFPYVAECDDSAVVV